MKHTSQANRTLGALIITFFGIMLTSCKDSPFKYTDLKSRYDTEDLRGSGKIKSITIKQYDPLMVFDKVEVGKEYRDSYYEYVYDISGNIIERNTIYYTEGLLYKDKFTYKDDGNLDEINTYEKNGNSSDKTKYVRDNSDLTETDYGINGKMKRRKEYVFDNNNCIISYKAYDYGGYKFKIGERLFWYVQKCEDGRAVEKTDKQWKGTDSYIYDDKGRLSKINSEQYPDDSFEYLEEDEKGNWTKKITSSEGKPFKVTVRAITYY